MKPQTGKRTFTINIFPDISESRGSQEIEFGQLIEFNVRNISLKK